LANNHKRGLPRTQTALLPASVEDYVGSDSLVRVIDAYVNGLDMMALGFNRAQAAAVGRPGYAPDDLLKLYLYGYWNELTGSRKLEAACKRNLEVMWLMGQLAPDHKTISEFRRVNAEPFQRVCADFVQFLRGAELVGGEAPIVAVDGSKFKASASKASILSSEQLAKQREKVKQRIAEYLARMDEADEREEAQPDGAAVQAALAQLRRRAQKLEQAQAQLAEGKKEEASDKDQDEDPHNERVALSDPDCVMLKGKGGALAGYNVQQAVDSKHKLIVAHAVTTFSNDHSSLEPMAKLAKDALQADALVAVADTGYMNGEQAQACEDKGITPVVPMQQAAQTRAADCYPKTMFDYDAASDTYRCPAGELLRRFRRDRSKQTDYYSSAACKGCARRAQCTHSVRRTITRSWFAGAAERAHERANDSSHLMRLRSAIVEHPFANLKAMLQGSFSVRTLPKVKGEMALAVLTYNLKRAVNILGTAKMLERLAAPGMLARA
jgi:transposase